MKMYRPNFCSECGAKIIRLHWRAWSSRRFCDTCSARLRKERVTVPLLAAVALLGVGMLAGRAGRPAPPPLIIERSNAPLEEQGDNAMEDKDATSEESGVSGGSSSASSVTANSGTESAEVYICGARTKKGKPCSRRVHGPVRCWQHKGMPAMLPQEKLLVSDKL